MAELHLHLDGSPLDHPHWSAEAEDDFDSAALERAIVEARRREYQALLDLDAA